MNDILSCTENAVAVMVSVPTMNQKQLHLLQQDEITHNKFSLANETYMTQVSMQTRKNVSALVSVCTKLYSEQNDVVDWPTANNKRQKGCWVQLLQVVKN